MKPSFLSRVPPRVRERALALAGRSGPASLPLRIHSYSGPDESYRISVARNSIDVQAGSSPAATWALDTLSRLIKNHPRGLPHMEIEDEPVLPVRGFMLDISRCKVPSRETLLALVDLLADLRYNQFQIYIEHTFAFPGHEVVWKDASPLTAGEIRELDDACADRGIELVPNFNSFGHFERWLRHPEYRRLAECPDGFVHPVSNQRIPWGTTLRPDRKSLEFLNGLWAELLPRFRSSRFNIGCDEPWELGKGWSRSRCAARGRHTVYLEFLRKLRDQAARHGRRIQCWADILLEAPEQLNEVPSDAIPILWGYDADHPLDEQASQLAAADREYLVAPGTSAWNSFTGRWHVARPNILAAVDAARKHGARGILLTSWGDNGNSQAWPVFYPGLFLAAEAAWSGTRAGDASIARAMDRRLFSGTFGLGNILIRAGKIDDPIRNPPRNASPHHILFFRERFSHLGKSFDPSLPELEKVKGRIRRIRRDLARMRLRNPEARLVANEINLALDLAEWGVGRPSRKASAPRKAKAAEKLKPLIARYQKGWLQRARPGGLAESVGSLCGVMDGLK